MNYRNKMRLANSCTSDYNLILSDLRSLLLFVILFFLVDSWFFSVQNDLFYSVIQGSFHISRGKYFEDQVKHKCDVEIGNLQSKYNEK